MHPVKRSVRRRPSPAFLLASAAMVVALIGATGSFALGSAGNAPVAGASKQAKHKPKRGRRGPRGPRGKRGAAGPAGPQGPPGKGTAFDLRANGTLPTQTIVATAGLSIDATCTAGSLSVKARSTEDHSIIHLTTFQGAAVSSYNDDDFTQSDVPIDLGVNNQGLFDYVSPGGQVLQVTYLTVSGGTRNNCVFAGYYSIG